MAAPRQHSYRLRLSPHGRLAYEPAPPEHASPADRLLGPTAAGETLLTEMRDEELLGILSLDVGRAAME